jgi:hypothetical protein
LNQFWSCSYQELKIATEPFEGDPSNSTHSAEFIKIDRKIVKRHN